MEQLSTLTKACTVIDVSEDKANHLRELAKLNAETLALLAELSRKPGAEVKLKKNALLIKAFL